jgi:hypothetical protein
MYTEGKGIKVKYIKAKHGQRKHRIERRERDLGMRAEINELSRKKK